MGILPETSFLVATQQDKSTPRKREGSAQEGLL